MNTAFKLADEWEVGDEVVVLEAARVWRIRGFIGPGKGKLRIADLEPVGFKFDGLHSTYVNNLRPVLPPEDEAGR